MTLRSPWVERGRMPPKREEIRAVTCPLCQAAIGQPCLSERRTERPGHHIERVIACMDQQEAPPPFATPA